MAPGISLLQVPMGVRFLMSEVPLCWPACAMAILSLDALWALSFLSEGPRGVLGGWARILSFFLDVPRDSQLVCLFRVVWGRTSMLGVVSCAGLVERDFFIDNLLIQIHSIIDMTSVDRPCAMGV